MSILASLFKRFTRRKPKPLIRRATEPMSSLSKIIDGWNPPADPEPVQPATSFRRLAEIRSMIPDDGDPIGDPRFDLLYLDGDNEVFTREEGWYVQNAIRTEIAKDLVPETIAQARLAIDTFPINDDGWHYCPPGFKIPTK